MTTRNAVSVLIAVGIAFGLGVYIGAEWPGRGNAGVDTEARPPNRHIEPQRSVTRGAPTDTLLPEDTSRPTAASEWQVLAALKKRNMATPRLTFVAQGRKVHPDFATLFELTTAERAALQAAVERAGERLAELERVNATVARDEKGIVIIAVKPFAADGGVVYDELMQAFAGTLGEQRYGAFVTLGAEQVERALGSFGAQERTIRFSYEPSRQNMPYIIRDELRTGTQQRHATTNVFQHRAEMVERIGTVARLLPPDFDARK